MSNVSIHGRNIAFRGSLQHKFSKNIYTKAQLNEMFAKLKPKNMKLKKEECANLSWS